MDKRISNWFSIAIDGEKLTKREIAAMVELVRSIRGQRKRAQIELKKKCLQQYPHLLNRITAEINRRAGPFSKEFFTLQQVREHLHISLEYPENKNRIIADILHARGYTQVKEAHIDGKHVRLWGKAPENA
jgi:hypothetical protein